MSKLTFAYSNEEIGNVSSSLDSFMDREYRRLVSTYGADGRDYQGHIKKFLVSAIKKLVSKHK